MNNVIPLPGSEGWSQRKAVGDAHEARVRAELEARNWTVQPYGQGIFSEQVRHALQTANSEMRYDPDMVAVRNTDICFIDAKASMQGRYADTYRITRRSLNAARRFWVMFDLPVWFVFSNMGVASPADVMDYCGLTRLGAAGGYVSFSAGLPKPFELIFGPPTGGVMSVLRAA